MHNMDIYGTEGIKLYYSLKYDMCLFLSDALFKLNVAIHRLTIFMLKVKLPNSYLTLLINDKLNTMPGFNAKNLLVLKNKKHLFFISVTLYHH